MDLQTYRKKKEMDLLVTSVPGMEGFLRQRDLPSFCLVDQIDDPVFEAVKIETRRTTRARALILNTFEDIEEPVFS